tara:strand:+ start:610 stop:867 length:258 start_codon:yes stop_codon:yes gene_type:complete
VDRDARNKNEERLMDYYDKKVAEASDEELQVWYANTMHTGMTALGHTKGHMNTIRATKCMEELSRRGVFVEFGKRKPVFNGEGCY